jgi:hypothetical protein
MGPAGPTGPAGPPGISGYENDGPNQQTTVTVQAGTNQTATITCPAGKKALSMGWRPVSNLNGGPTISALIVTQAEITGSGTACSFTVNNPADNGSQKIGFQCTCAVVN